MRVFNHTVYKKDFKNMVLLGLLLLVGATIPVSIYLVQQSQTQQQYAENVAADRGEDRGYNEAMEGMGFRYDGGVGGVGGYVPDQNRGYDYNPNGGGIAQFNQAQSNPQYEISPSLLASSGCSGSGACSVAIGNGILSRDARGNWTFTATGGGYQQAVNVNASNSPTALGAPGTALAPGTGPIGANSPSTGTPPGVDRRPDGSVVHNGVTYPPGYHNVSASGAWLRDPTTGNFIFLDANGRSVGNSQAAQNIETLPASISSVVTTPQQYNQCLSSCNLGSPPLLDHGILTGYSYPVFCEGGSCTLQLPGGVNVPTTLVLIQPQDPVSSSQSGPQSPDVIIPQPAAQTGGAAAPAKPGGADIPAPIAKDDFDYTPGMIGGINSVDEDISSPLPVTPIQEQSPIQQFFSWLQSLFN